MAITVVATAAFGLEAVVVRELANLGYHDTRVEAGRIRFTGDEAAICRCNLWLRSADRILVELGNFPAADFDALFEQTRALPWEEWLGRNAAFPVNGKTVRSQLTSMPAIQRSVKKAIVERLSRHYGLRELPETGPSASVEVAILKDQASLLLDCSGLGLHKRGYGAEVGEAPIKETLAAGMVALSFWHPERPLLDPFCGTGTIAIEAAMIGLNQAPGLRRRFDAEAWPRLPPALWEQARTEARDRILTGRPLQIFASDIDSRVIDLARRRAKAAGVAEHIQFAVRDVFERVDLPEYGCLITNPPYGERMSSDWEVRRLYESLPPIFARLPTWSLYMITSHSDTETLLGREADRRRKLYNGRLECTYYQFFGPRPPRNSDLPEETVQASDSASGDNDGEVSPPASASVVPAFGRLPERAHAEAEQFTSRLQKRAHHLRRWPTRQGITCFRIYNQDVPGVPLVIDRYENLLHVTDYSTPDRHPSDQHQAWLDLMQGIMCEVLEVKAEDIFIKARQRQAGKTQHERLDTRKHIVVVNEGGLKFEVNLTDYVDTGLFLDHRQTRAMVRDLAAGKDVLNLFCYTGAFSVYAAAGGGRTCSVDLSNTYLDWTDRNLRLNNFHGTEHRLIRRDVVTWLRDECRESFDIAIVDPPTFSNSKSTETVWDVKLHHADLLRLTLARLRPGGICFFSTNLRKFKFNAPDIEETCEVREITRQTLPPDFEDGRGAHRCWRITKPTP